MTNEFLKSGYVTKPITGRGGGNVVLYDTSGQLLDKTSGRWNDEQEVYQELCTLPKYDGDYVQVCCWTIDGEYAGTVLRVDKTRIVGMESSVICLRAVSTTSNL